MSIKAKSSPLLNSSKITEGTYLGLIILEADMLNHDDRGR